MFFNGKASRKSYLILMIIIGVCSYLIKSNIKRSANLCFVENKWNDGKTLPNVESDFNLNFHKSQKNIFFHETSCSNDGIIKLNSRQACAIESAALMNPNHNVYVLFASQVGFRNATNLPIIDALASYPNIKFLHSNVIQYAQNTPLEDWIHKGALFRSRFLASHTSDVLRFLSLYKYGGTYLDLDTVAMRPLSDVKPNFVVDEAHNIVGSAVLNMEGEKGHQIAGKCLKDLLDNFSETKWTTNGPDVITRVMQSVCRTIDVLEMVKYCKKFQVLPVETFYSIRWYEHRKFFQEDYLNETMSRLSNSIVAHVWSSYSAKTPLTVDSNVAYIHLAKKHCPNIISVSNIF